MIEQVEMYRTADGKLHESVARAEVETWKKLCELQCQENRESTSGN